PVGAAAAQVLAQGQVVEGDPAADDVATERVLHRRHRTNLAVTASPWAGRSSAAASETTCSATSRSASSVYSTTWTPLRNVCTDRPAGCRAQPPVGSTWLEPAQ